MYVIVGGKSLKATKRKDGTYFYVRNGKRISVRTNQKLVARKSKSPSKSKSRSRSKKSRKGSRTMKTRKSRAKKETSVSDDDINERGACKGRKKSECYDDPNCTWRKKRGCGAKPGVRKGKVAYEGPMGPEIDTSSDED